QAVARRKSRKPRLDRRIAAAQFVIFGVGDRGGVFLIIAAVMAGGFVRKPRMLAPRLLLCQPLHSPEWAFLRCPDLCRAARFQAFRAFRSSRIDCNLRFTANG